MMGNSDDCTCVKEITIELVTSLHSIPEQLSPAHLIVTKTDTECSSGQSTILCVACMNITIYKSSVLSMPVTNFAFYSKQPTLLFIVFL